MSPVKTSPKVRTPAKPEKTPPLPKPAELSKGVELSAPVAESTKIEPSFIYRAAALSPVANSVYHKPEHGNFVDQMYLTLLFDRTYNYVNEVVLEPSLRTYRTNPGTWEPYVIEQAYIESALSPHLGYTAGKKNEYEGTGFIVNPSDLLNEGRDVFDPMYQKEGVAFTRLRYRTDSWSLGLGFIPVRGESSTAGQAWLTAAGELMQTDLRLQLTSQAAAKTTTGVSAQRFFGGSFELHFDGRYQERQRDPTAVGQEYLLYSSYIGSDPHSRSDDTSSGFYLVGTRLIFSPRRTFVLEGIQQQSGLLGAQFQTMFMAFHQDQVENNKTREPPTHLLGRHYVFLSFQDDDSLKATHFAASYLRNTDDGSVFATASALYTLSPITSIEFAPTLFVGKRYSEFGEMPFAQAHYLVFRGKF